MVKLNTIAILTATLAGSALSAPALANADTTTTNNTALDAILASHKAAALASLLPSNSTIPATTPSLTNRDTAIPTTGVYYCTKNDFKGHCEYDHGPLNVCHDFRSAYSAKVNSFGPEKTTWWPNVGNYHCLLYMSKGCKSNDVAVTIAYPGTGNLLKYLQGKNSKVWWDDGDMMIMQTVRSWRCFNHN